MRFGDPAGLWLGAAAAFVLAAYLVRRRVRRVEVPFLPLWTGALTERRGGFGSALTRWLDLLFALLACAAVAMAAGSPFLPGEESTVRDLVLVMDGGLELRAGDRREKLIKIAEAEVRRRAPGTRYFVVRVDPSGPRLHVGTARAQALAFVRAHDGGWKSASSEEAQALAREGALGLQEPDLVFCTYRPGRPEGFRLRTEMGEAPNAGFTALEVLGDPEGGGRLARMRLRGKGRLAVDGPDAQSSWEGEVDGAETIDLPLPASGEVTFTLRAPLDLFAPDNRLFLYLPERKQPRVLVVSEDAPSPFLTSAMAALEQTRAIRGPLDRTKPEHVAEAARLYDVIVFDRCAAPKPIAGLRALYLAPDRGALPFKLGPWADAPTLFDVQDDHPLVRGTGFSRIPPLRARAIRGGEAIASAAPGPVLAVAGNWVALGFDPDACVLASSPAYPLFLRGAIAHLAGSAPTRLTEFVTVGERAPGKGIARWPDESRHPIGERVFGPPGFWRIGEGDAMRTWAVNLLAPGLDLSPATEPSDPLTPTGLPAVPDHPLTPAFAGAALLLLLLGWWWYWRGNL